MLVGRTITHVFCKSVWDLLIADVYRKWLNGVEFFRGEGLFIVASLSAHTFIFEGRVSSLESSVCIF